MSKRKLIPVFASIMLIAMTNISDAHDLGSIKSTTQSSKVQVQNEDEIITVVAGDGVYSGGCYVIPDESFIEVEDKESADGENGEFVSAQAKEETLKRQSLLNLAYSKQGCPYSWGLAGPNSFDCSGFAYYTYKNAVGITLPRTSSQQAKVGTTVNKSDLKPGDLVFFNTSGRGISHVGIYVGNGNMIHAPSSGKTVRVESINSSYYKSRYVTAKRIL